MGITFCICDSVSRLQEPVYIWTYLDYETRSEAKNRNKHFVLDSAQTDFIPVLVDSDQNQLLRKTPSQHTCKTHDPSVQSRAPSLMAPQVFLLRLLLPQNYVVLSIENTHCETTKNSREKYREYKKLTQNYSNVSEPKKGGTKIIVSLYQSEILGFIYIKKTR